MNRLETNRLLWFVLVLQSSVASIKADLGS